MKVFFLETAKWICFGAMVFLLVSTLVKGTPSTTPFEEVLAVVTSASDMDSMNEGDNQMIRRLYELNPEEYQGIALYYPASNMGAEELLVVRLADASQEEAVMDAVKNRLQSQKDNFEGYGAEQTEMLKHSVIESKGNYVLFAVSKQPAVIREAFLGIV